MTGAAWGLLAVAAVLAVGDWWAVWFERRPVRSITKPLSLAFLIAVALVAQPFDDGVRAWMVAGLVLSLAGDVFLLGSERWFVYGLASFLAGHVTYVVAMGSQFDSLGWLAVGLLVVGAGIATFGRTVVSVLRKRGLTELLGPVIAYVLVISAMVVSAFGTASAWAVVGALLFYVSDGVLALNRFAKPLRFGPLAVMVTYHLAQACLVAWVING